MYGLIGFFSVQRTAFFWFYLKYVEVTWTIPQQRLLHKNQ